MCLCVRGVGWGRHPWRALGTSQHAEQSNKHAKHGPLDLIPCPCLEFWKSPQSGEGWAAWPCSQSHQNGGCTVWGPVGPEPREPCAAAQGWERRASHSCTSTLTFCAKPQSPRPPGTARGTEDKLEAEKQGRRACSWSWVRAQGPAVQVQRCRVPVLFSASWLRQGPEPLRAGGNSTYGGAPSRGSSQVATSRPTRSAEV